MTPMPLDATAGSSFAATRTQMSLIEFAVRQSRE